MKNFFFILCICLSFLGASAQSDTSAYRAAAISIQKKFAPDKRAVYFNLQIKGDSVKLESSAEEVLREFDKVRPTMASINFTAVLLPSASLMGLEYAVGNLSVGNNRANPQHQAELMTQTLLGTPLRVLKKQGGYYLVKTPDDYLAWTDAGAIKLMNKQQFDAWQKAEKIIFISDYGHGFSAADINSPRVSDLVGGNILQLMGEVKDFYKVAYPDGRLAFVPKAQATSYRQWVKRPNPNANAILTTAQTLIGVPYLWGGTSIKGVDCSGFTKTAYFLNGIVIPRDASQQALVGDPVDVLEKDTISITKCLKNLQPGDLLFFSAAKRRGINGGRVSHTAIYMGNGEFIQSAGMVKISSMLADAPNYDGAQISSLVGARRILTEIGKPQITRIDHHDWYGKN
jgi:cell wall-associated NlpC family hydrolase